MTHPTDEELDALVKRMESVSLQVGLPSRTILDSAVIRQSAAAITALRAQLAEVKAERDEYKRLAQYHFDLLAESNANTITSLREQVSEFEEMLDAAEKSNRISDNGNMWRFWADKAREIAVRLDEANARADRAETENRRLKAAIFGSEDYALDLKCGNFVEMAQVLHAAQKGGLERAERAEAEIQGVKKSLITAEAALAAQIEVDAKIAEAERKLWDRGYNTSAAGFYVCRSLANVRDAIRNQPHDKTALASYREKVLREAADRLLGSIKREYHDHRDYRAAILAMIDKEGA